MSKESNIKFFVLIILIIAGIIILIVTIPLRQQADSTTSGKITALTIAKDNDKSKYYGKSVKGYHCIASGVEDWKLFYADEKNIYLIANDYIPFYSCPNSATQKISNSSSSDYFLSMSNVIKDYKGSEDIANEEIRKLNSDYFKITENHTSTKDNIKAVAYMLDTKIWKDYAGYEAEYAIGGPSLEMFLASYNQKYNTNFRAKSDECGYRISDNNGKSWNDSASFEIVGNDDLYFSSKKAYSMWLASPSCWANSRVLTVSYFGTIAGSYFYSEGEGFRPIVCLKPNISLKYQDDDLKIVKD